MVQICLRLENLELYLINSKIEASKDDSTACNSCKTCSLPKNEICEQDVEHCGQAPPDVVEGDAHMSQAQVVECDHPNKDDGEGKHLNFVFWMC